jgi:endonuclease/exonuclease/phosphatase (EEP) superfamily protein YafD
MGDQPATEGRGRRPRWHWYVLMATLPAMGVILAAQAAAWWWIGEMSVHWTLHAVVAMLPALCLFGRDPRWGRLFLVLLLLGLLPWAQMAYAPRAAVVPPLATVRLSVLSANIYYPNPERPRLFAALKAEDAEVMGLVEVATADRKLLGTDPRWPHQVWTGRDDVFKAALLSRRRVVWSKIHEIDGTTAIEALIDLGDGPLRVFLVHPHSPVTPARAQRRDGELAALARLIVATEEPLLVMGDFNLTAAAPMWRSFTAATRLRPAPGREPATWPWFLGAAGIAIDHVLARGAALAGLRAVWLPGSDHRGLAATIIVPVEPDGALVR